MFSRHENKPGLQRYYRIVVMQCNESVNQMNGNFQLFFITQLQNCLKRSQLVHSDSRLAKI